MELIIVLVEGLDRSNPGEETICEIKVLNETTLQKVHEAIVTVLSLDECLELFYHKEGIKDFQLPLSSTFNELHVLSGDRMILDARYLKKRKISAKQLGVISESSILELICTTKLIDSDGQPLKKTRVVVHSHHCINYLMNDISNLWNKGGALKFKNGSKVLSGDKTYLELGVRSGSQILITGGRG